MLHAINVRRTKTPFSVTMIPRVLDNLTKTSLAKEILKFS